MKIFLSWSGNQSLLLAKALRKWLPFVFQGIEPPFVSDKDIEAGELWPERLSTVLENYDFGIVCLTASNLDKPYIMFESGALAKKVGQAKLIPVLCGLTPSDLIGNPLALYQGVSLDSEGIWKLAQSINTSLGDNKLPESMLEKTFNMWWPELKGEIKAIAETPDSEAPKKKIDSDAVLEETLSIVRGLARNQEGPLTRVVRSSDINYLANELGKSALSHWRVSKSDDVVRANTAALLALSAAARGEDKTENYDKPGSTGKDLKGEPKGE